jgi:hypothetical protein
LVTRLSLPETGAATYPHKSPRPTRQPGMLRIESAARSR